MKIFGLKVTWESWFALIAIIISIFALIQSCEANKLSKELNKIETERDGREYEKGKVALINLIAKYFILNYQRTEFYGTNFSVRTKSPYSENYIEEIERLSNQFDELIDNPYYIKIFKKYPLIGSINLFLQKEIMFIKNSKSKNEQYGYDYKVWENMFKAFSVLRKEILSEKEMDSDKTLIESKELNDIYDYAKNVNEYLSLKKN